MHSHVLFCKSNMKSKRVRLCHQNHEKNHHQGFETSANLLWKQTITNTPQVCTHCLQNKQSDVPDGCQRKSDCQPTLLPPAERRTQETQNSRIICLYGGTLLQITLNHVLTSHQRRHATSNRTSDFEHGRTMCYSDRLAVRRGHHSGSTCKCPSCWTVHTTGSQVLARRYMQRGRVKKREAHGDQRIAFTHFRVVDSRRQRGRRADGIDEVCAGYITRETICETDVEKSAARQTSCVAEECQISSVLVMLSRP